MRTKSPVKSKVLELSTITPSGVTVTPRWRISRLYDPRLCDTILEHMANGMSVAECCAQLGISYGTWRNWLERYPEFCEAVEIGFTLCQAWWESKGRTNLLNKDFNNPLYSLVMGHRFGYVKQLSGTLNINSTQTKRLEVSLDASPDRRCEVLRVLQESGALKLPEFSEPTRTQLAPSEPDLNPLEDEG